MKKCKLIVVDLDGTLLRDDKSISSFTVETLMACRNQGILVGFATARPVRGVAEIRELFEPDILINHNGAVFTHGDLQDSFGINREQFRVLLAEILAVFPNAEVGVESDDVFYANYDVTKNWPDEPYMSVDGDLVRLEVDYVDKILVSLHNIDVEVLKSYLPDECYLEIADGVMGMVMSKKATKFNSIVSVCDALGISPSEVICFGDDNNDISMIQGCGIGVAMDNAHVMVKEAADVVCLSNESDGVARWIMDNLLSGFAHIRD